MQKSVPCRAKWMASAVPHEPAPITVIFISIPYCLNPRRIGGMVKYSKNVTIYLVTLFR